MMIIYFLLKVVLVVAFVWCYWRGSRSQRWIKVWVGGGIWAGGNVLLALMAQKLNVLAFIASVAYLGAMTLPHGVNDGNVAKKIGMRALQGGTMGLCGLFYAGALGHWDIGWIQMVASTVGTIVLGVFNPFSKDDPKGADKEDVSVALISVVMRLFF